MGVAVRPRTADLLAEMSPEAHAGAVRTAVIWAMVLITMALYLLYLAVVKAKGLLKRAARALWRRVTRLDSRIDRQGQYVAHLEAAHERFGLYAQPLAIERNKLARLLAKKGPC